jgi:hypothetical protein
MQMTVCRLNFRYHETGLWQPASDYLHTFSTQVYCHFPLTCTCGCRALESLAA